MANSPYCRSCLRLARSCSQLSSTITPTTRTSTFYHAVRSASTSTKPLKSHGASSASKTQPRASAAVAPPPAPPPPASAPPNRTGNSTTKQTTPQNFEAPLSKPSPITATALAQQLRTAAPSLTETYVAYGVCELLVKEAARTADYTMPKPTESNPTPKSKYGEDIGVPAEKDQWWYTARGLNLQPTFNTWAQITMLHMYLITVRLRCFPKDHAPAWHQHLINHFFYLAEDRMTVLHGIDSRMARNKYLKDLYTQWRGLLAAYDQGLMEGDAVLATAVWRNIFRAEPDVDLVRLAEVVSFMRSVLAGFDGMQDEALATGDVAFGDPGAEAEVVRRRSPLLEQAMREPMTATTTTPTTPQKAPFTPPKTK